MVAPELAARVLEALTTDAATFAEHAREEASALKSDLRDGTFNNPQASVGMEYELYGVDDDAALVRVPRRLLDLIGFEPEIGIHNAELHTDPQPFNEFGLAAQRTELQARLAAANERAAAEGIRLVSDGMWTIPPVGESARAYLVDLLPPLKGWDSRTLGYYGLESTTSARGWNPRVRSYR